MVVALWLSGRGLQSLAATPADLLMSLGRVTGLVAADLLLIQVFLMARVPWIERSYGQDELARRHRLVGFWSFNLMLAHIVLITLGYTLADHSDVVHETWKFVTSYGGMLLAVAGTAALTVVTVTSVRAARRVLRYESWHLLHLYAYVGVGLSIPHEIWTGTDFITSPLARVYWWASYLVAAGAALVFRVGIPVWRTLRHGITVTSVVRESNDVVTVHMGGRGLHRLPVQAGQFFIWRFLDGPGWSRGNPYSLSGAPRPGRVQITAKDLGDGSGRLAHLRPGTKVLIEGPYGRLTGEHRVGDKVAMLACGIGITPMRALLEDLPYKRGDATLIYRARSEPDVIFRNELDELGRTRGITVHYLTGPRIPGRGSWLPHSHARWRDNDVLRRLVPDLTSRDVFVCGPDAWMEAVSKAALDAGLPAGQLHQERFTW
ncbi:MAG: oxidoreductase [Frankiales bacterium]|nr:oxidoreductase [Frankiales bacterium]